MEMNEHSVAIYDSWEMLLHLEMHKTKPTDSILAAIVDTKLGL